MIYEFFCSNCGKIIEKVFKLADRPDEIDCPDCFEIGTDKESDVVVHEKAKRIMSVPAKGRIK